MYRLYGNIKGWKLLKTTESETSILKCLKQYINDYNEINYIIIKNEYNADFPYKVIYNMVEYFNYINEFNEKIKKMQ